MSSNNLVIKKGHVVVVYSGVPRAQREKVRKMLFSTIDQIESILTVPASKVHEQIKKEIPLAGTPAGALRAYRYREDLTQAQLAKKTGIAQGHISAMERGKRAIGIKSAKTLAKALNCRWEKLLSQ